MPTFQFAATIVNLTFLAWYTRRQMVSAFRQATPAVTQPTSTTTNTLPVADVRSRITAYLADSVVLLVVLLFFFFLAGTQLLIADSRADGEVSDAAFSLYFAILLAGTVITWTVANSALFLWRGQSIGMFVVGLKVTSESGEALTGRHILIRWFGLSPLLYHPLLLPALVGIGVVATAATWNILFLAFSLMPALLCVIAPLLNLLLMLLDRDRRALHDRLSHTIVVRIEPS